MKKIFITACITAFIIILFGLPASAAQNNKCGDALTWEYNSETKELTITGEGEMTDYNWFYVESMEHHGYSDAPWWEYADEIEKVNLDDRITRIGSHAFMWCDKLKGPIKLPKALLEIGEYAFCDCRSLNKTLVLPKKLMVIEECAFTRCEALTGDLTIPYTVTKIGGSAFMGCCSINGMLTLPVNSNFNTIEEFTFEGCSSFTGSLKIPDNVITIKYYAFSDCSSFDRKLTISQNATSICEWAFRNCSSLTGDLIIPASVEGIGDGAFINCKSLEAIYFQGNAPSFFGFYMEYGVPFDLGVTLHCIRETTGWDEDVWAQYDKSYETGITASVFAEPSVVIIIIGTVVIFLAIAGAFILKKFRNPPDKCPPKSICRNSPPTNPNSDFISVESCVEIKSK